MSIKTGSCLCGKIEYQVFNIKQRIGHCHCQMCRKFHGAAFSTFGEVDVENFDWLKGEELLKQFRADNLSLRKFCSECGSSLVFIAAGQEGKSVEFTLATLDCDIEQRPDAHIFVDYKADWFELADELPKHGENRDH